MATMGRPPKPIERKRATGNPGRRPLPATVVALPPVDQTPDPLRPLAAAGQGLWERAWSVGSAWVSAHSDIDLLQIVCEQLDERNALRLAVLRLNDKDDRKALRELDRQIVGNLSLLGFTPTDRARIGVAEIKAQSTLEKLRAARAK